MTEAQANEAITAAFAAGWPAASNNVPFVTDNQAITLPSSGAFAALTITHTTSSQRTVGGAGTRRVERHGWVTVKLWVPAGTLTAGMSTLVAAVRAVLELKSLPGPTIGDEPLTLFEAGRQPGGNDGRWYMALVSTPFVFAETV